MNKCKIIVYHYVRHLKNAQYKIYGMEVEKFEKQIRILKKTHNPIEVEEIIEVINNDKSIAKNSIMFTFDDGLKDHYKYVFPILKENKIEFSAQASAVAATAGASANVKYVNGVMVFSQVKGGLMYEASVGGQKFSYTDF